MQALQLRCSSTGPFELQHPQCGIDKLITIGRLPYGVDQSFVDETPAHPIENLLFATVSLFSHNLKRAAQRNIFRVAWKQLWWGKWFVVQAHCTRSEAEASSQKVVIHECKSQPRLKQIPNATSVYSTVTSSCFPASSLLPTTGTLSSSKMYDQAFTRTCESPRMKPGSHCIASHRI